MSYGEIYAPRVTRAALNGARIKRARICIAQYHASSSQGVAAY